MSLGSLSRAHSEFSNLDTGNCGVAKYKLGNYQLIEYECGCAQIEQ